MRNDDLSETWFLIWKMSIKIVLPRRIDWVERLKSIEVRYFPSGPVVKTQCSQCWRPRFDPWSVQFSRSVVSDSLWPHESQHARPPCPSPTPGDHPDSRPSSQWCHPAISSSVIPFSCPQSLPASESFPMSQFFTWGGQSTGVSALASFLPKKSQGWSPSEWTGWIQPLQSKGLSRVFSKKKESSPWSGNYYRSHIPQLKSLHATTKTQCSQIYK